MAKIKAKRVLFFVNGALASKSDNELAEAIKQEGYVVAFRNANFVGSGGLEEAEAVAGAVPAAYRESGNYQIVGETTKPSVETPRDESAGFGFGNRPPITSGYPGNFAAPIENENGRDIPTANEGIDAVERARRSVNIPGVDYTQVAPLSTSPNSAPAVTAATDDGNPENGTAGPSTSEQGRAIEEAVRDGSPNPATGGNQGEAGRVGKLAGTDGQPNTAAPAASAWGASPAAPKPSGAGWSPNGSDGTQAPERPALDATNAVLADYIEKRTGTRPDDKATKAELNTAIDAIVANDKPTA